MIAYADTDSRGAEILRRLGAVQRGYDPQVGWGQTTQWDIPQAWFVEHDADPRRGYTFRGPDGVLYHTYPGCAHYRGGCSPVQG